MKRGILSTVCSLFDPLGFAAPVALTTLCVVQDLWKANVGWDEPLSNEFLSGEHGTLSYTRCISFGPTSCLTVTCVNASYSLMCFQMRQRLLMERDHICEASTTMDEFIAPSSLAKLGTPLWNLLVFQDWNCKQMYSQPACKRCCERNLSWVVLSEERETITSDLWSFALKQSGRNKGAHLYDWQTICCNGMSPSSLTADRKWLRGVDLL